MITADKLEVLYDGIRVGTMASYQRYRTAFEYSAEWLRDGFSISPFSLPLEPGVKIAGAVPFDGLFGIFADSLPDGWGRLLVDRMLRKNGEDPAVTGPLARLSIVGESGMGALEYRPVFDMQKQKQTGDLDWLAEECARVLRSEKTEDLDTLFALGGSSGGACGGDAEDTHRRDRRSLWKGSQTGERLRVRYDHVSCCPRMAVLPVPFACDEPPDR